MGSVRTPTASRTHQVDADGTCPVAIIKRCACGAIYSQESWAELALCGTMTVDNETAEIRHCSCGSTLALRKA